jgi:Domain of unknown function (DUF6249)
MHNLEEIFIPAIIFGIIAYILKIWMDHREKMRLIKLGADMPKYESTKTFFSWLKLAGLLIGFGVGILAGNIIANTTVLNEEVSHFSMILMCGGIAVFITHMLERKGVI